MTQTINFTNDNIIGNVIYVDTNQVLIKVIDDKVSSLNIGSIVGIQTTRKHNFIIGIIEKIKRKEIDLKESKEDSDDFENSQEFFEDASNDLIQISLIGTFKEVDGNKKNVFRRGIEVFPQITHKCYSINGDNLIRFMNSINNENSSKNQLIIGKFAIDDSAIAILDGNKFFQRHASILGSTGSGKSWCVANLIEQASKLKNPNILVFDMHGEYKSLCDSDKKYAEYYKIAGPGDLEKNDDKYIFLPYWLLNRDEMLSMILDRSDNNAPNQASRFTYHIRELKEKTLKNENNQKILDTFTVDSPIPFKISELIDSLKSDDTGLDESDGKKPKKLEWNGKLTRFISRLENKINDKRYGFLFKPNESTLDYNWLSEFLIKIVGFNNNKRGIKIIDFSEVPVDVLPIVTGIISRLLFDIQVWINEEKREPFAILCDEAHLYLPVQENADSIQKQALNSFERIAKEGRKYGISLVVISQRPSDVSKTVLSQCNNFLVLRLSNERDKSVVKNLLPDNLKGVLDQLPLLDIGEAIALGDAILLPSRIKLTAPELKPLSATIDMWSEWENEKSGEDNDAICEAVENMRSQTKNK